MTEHFMSVGIWFQDWAHLGPESTVRVLPHNHRSVNNYFSIVVNFFTRMVPHFYGQHDSLSNLAKSRYPLRKLLFPIGRFHF
jgi:hypothetical protein